MQEIERDYCTFLKPKTMEPYNEKQAFAVYCTFAGVFLIALLFLIFKYC